MLQKTVRTIYRKRQISLSSLVIAEVKGKVGLITLNRTKALNALCDQLLDDLIVEARKFDTNDDIGAIVITGSEKAFAAGADIKEMSNRNFVDVYTKNQFKNWTDITKITKPVNILLIN
jgi:enoyl-CoA hydratase/carnithine racemase